ncbi:MAG: cysteine desulfurase [Ruminococcaceae bacterium]|nr:cysteine desulfurase [Oscillospiraceae bacterium]
MMEIYLDNSATTKVCEAAAKKAYDVMLFNYGNPSSLHSLGFSAEKIITEARRAVASVIKSEANEIYFTSGGTESNNTAIFGAVKAKKRLGNKIVTTAIEHPSVLECMKELEKEGFEVVYLKPDSSGNISKAQVLSAIDGRTVLVSMMSVNNETGAIMPLDIVAPAIKKANSPALFHIDNVQGFGKINLNAKKLSCDLMSISGHKLHAPKGIGALYINTKAHILPHHFGGGQEKGIRPGTEPVPLIAAFSEAVKELPETMKEYKRLYEINMLLREKLREIPGVTINSPENNLPYILNFSTMQVRGETMLHYLESKNIYVSTGSACSKAKPSHVLSGMGLSNKHIETSLRASFSRNTTKEEVLLLAEEIRNGLSSLAHIK